MDTAHWTNNSGNSGRESDLSGGGEFIWDKWHMKKLDEREDGVQKKSTTQPRFLQGTTWKKVFYSCRRDWDRRIGCPGNDELGVASQLVLSESEMRIRCVGQAEHDKYLGSFFMGLGASSRKPFSDSAEERVWGEAIETIQEIGKGALTELN